MTETYRNTFCAKTSAIRYDEVVYRPGSSADILWRVELRILRSLASDVLSGKSNPRYLDFACGTGRIVSAVEDLAAEVTGIDVSQSMLDRAQQRCARARFICRDITRDRVIEGEYDLITAFRFLTNAEEELRAAALSALRDRLADGGALLINTHGNPFSYRLLFLPYHWLKDRLARRPLYGYLSTGKARGLLERAGFKVEQVIGMGFVPAKLLTFVGVPLASWIEDHLAGMPGIQRIGLNQLFVCRKT